MIVFYIVFFCVCVGFCLMFKNIRIMLMMMNRYPTDNNFCWFFRSRVKNFLLDLSGSKEPLWLFLINNFFLHKRILYNTRTKQQYNRSCKSHDQVLKLYNYSQYMNFNSWTWNIITTTTHMWIKHFPFWFLDSIHFLLMAKPTHKLI